VESKSQTARGEDCQNGARALNDVRLSPTMMRAPTSVVDTTLAIASGRKQVRAPFKQLPVARSVRADSAPPGVDQCVDGTGQPYSEIPLTGLACAPPHLVQQRQFRERRVPCSHSARSPSAGSRRAASPVRAHVGWLLRPGAPANRRAPRSPQPRGTQ
jgi:hypothetical protein